MTNCVDKSVFEPKKCMHFIEMNHQLFNESIITYQLGATIPYTETRKWKMSSKTFAPMTIAMGQLLCFEIKILFNPKLKLKQLCLLSALINFDPSLISRGWHIPVESHLDQLMRPQPWLCNHKKLLKGIHLQVPLPKNNNDRMHLLHFYSLVDLYTIHFWQSKKISHNLRAVTNNIHW